MTATQIPAELLPANFSQTLREVSEGSGIYVLNIRCTCCKAGWVGDDSDRIVIKHTRSCDHKNSVTRPTTAQVAQTVERAERAVKAATDAQIIAAARNGNAAAVATTDDLVDLVRSGRLSMSDAMNQDM